MTTRQLQDLLSEHRGACPVTLDALTMPDWIGGTPPEIKAVRKFSRVNGMIGWVYQNSVNNQRVRENIEPDFVPLKRIWGERKWPSPLVEHKGKFYLEVKVERVLYTAYWKPNGFLIEPEIVKPWERKRDESARQGTEKKTILRDYELCNIKAITINQEFYQIGER